MSLSKSCTIFPCFAAEVEQITAKFQVLEEFHFVVPQSTWRRYFVVYNWPDVLEVGRLTAIDKVQGDLLRFKFEHERNVQHLQKEIEHVSTQIALLLQCDQFGDVDLHYKSVKEIKKRLQVRACVRACVRLSVGVRTFACACM